jgi:hypothetical protein
MKLIKQMERSSSNHLRLKVGTLVGFSEGTSVGLPVGASVGSLVGLSVGAICVGESNCCMMKSIEVKISCQ